MQAVFQRCQKYGVPVHKCGHPKLNQYIRDILDGLKPLIVKQAVERVVLLIHTKARPFTIRNAGLS